MTAPSTPADAVATLVQQALGELGSGRVATARRLLRRAVDQASRAGGDEARVLRGRTLVTLAAAEHDRIGLDGALALLDEAEKLAVIGHAHPEAATVGVLTRVQRAALLGRSGRWQESVTLYDGLAGHPLLPSRAACAVELNRGLGRQFLGDESASEEPLRRAEEMAALYGHLDIQVAALHNRGALALRLGDVPTALELMARASALAPDVQPVAALLGHARALMEVGLTDEAGPLLSEAAGVASASGGRLDLAETWMEQARLALLRDDPAHARALARRAARSFERLGASTWARRARLVALEAGLMDAERPGSRAGSSRLVAEARSLTDGNDPMARALLATALVHAGQDQAAAVALGRFSRGAAPLSDTLRTGLARARVHAALGRRRSADAALAAAAELLARHQAGQSDLESRTALAVHGRRLRELDVALALADGGVPAVYRASERWRSVARRLPWIVPGAPVTETDLRPASLAAMRAALRSRRTGLISLIRHRGEVLALTLGDGRERLSRLGTEESWREAASRIAADALALSRVADPALHAVVRASLEASARHLGDLLAPAVPASACDQVVVIPSEILGPVAWRLVPGLAGRPIVVAPAATAWLERATTPAAGPDARTTALAGPGLERASAEATDVAALRGGMLLTGPDADRAALLDAVAAPGVVHVAAHGTHHEQSPMFSSIRLTDGPAYAHTIQRVGVRAGLIVLSACEVGRSQPRPGDEALGLTAALLACGGRTVVAACGPVPDATAAAMMPALHAGLLAGLDAATALERCAGDDPAWLFCAYGAA
ncbi:MAG: CHAT domain-containing protein [Propioniciclava sp.]|uniref:CHAT domain-containing protein n=1 Tax=Propioniciclava sp. TaxID=2038686 RepID=UPI0039E6D28A